MVAMITTCVLDRTPQFHVYVEDALTCVCGQQRLFPPPSYTLVELKPLMREFLDDMQHRGHVTTYGPDSLTDWKFETFLQWLAKREQGKER